MGAPVNVLAVMGRAIEAMNDAPQIPAFMSGELEEASAAVAELIEAGSALAAAQVKFDLHGGDPDECSAAWERHAAALARVQGGAA